jgi:hypothetical protein
MSFLRGFFQGRTGEIDYIFYNDTLDNAMIVIMIAITYDVIAL